MKKDVVIIGGGPAGLAAALECYKNGVSDVVILERDKEAGGILNQCIHNGFGLTRFKESLTGPEYAERFINEVKKAGIEYYTDTIVTAVTPDKKVKAINSAFGVFTIEAKAVIFAMGCRERSRGAINVPGTRPAGIYSAGTAQKYVNIKGILPGKRVVILGSGDIGLIMARRMTLEGAKVLAVCEIMPYSSGLKRNIVQCLDDFQIPLYLNHTITRIDGDKRVTGVVISEVKSGVPIKGTEKYIECDTVLFSVGLIPANELAKGCGAQVSPATKGAVVYQTRETSVPGTFACGNVLQVHDLVDFVSEEAEIAGKYCARYVLNGGFEYEDSLVEAGEGINYVVPQKINRVIEGDVKLFFRVKKTFKNCTIKVKSGDNIILERKKRVAVPGEMEYLIIPADKIQTLPDTITVEICE